MLTTHSTKLIALFTGLLLAGLLVGNLIILAMSLIPLSLLLIGLLTEPPRRLSIRASEIKSLIWLGDVVEIAWEVTVSDGFGVVSLFQELPGHFVLADGNNLKVNWKGWRSRTFTFSYKIRCVKRGSYILPPVKWEARHPLGLTQTRQGILGEPVELLVQPKILNLRRIRGVPGIATSPFPVIDIAKIGVATTDFREIRSYVHGDPVKNINWKATARRAAQGQLWPLVNEYEVEGKKAVWLFLDASSSLEVGTDIENAFEYCLEAANGVVYYFIDRGYRVGMYIYNDGNKLFYPDAGKKQFLRISQGLIKLKTTDQFDEFPRAIEKCRRYLLGYNPLCIIITRLDSNYSDTVVPGVTKLRQLRGRRRRKLPVMVVSVAGYHVIPRLDQYDDNTALMLQLKTRPLVQQLRRMGASILEWNPRQENFSTTLLRQVKTK
ncbi:DUF58 domain-containing protein [Dehalococcoidia bacterium]|nr:DUF58 domain-containing protein [Dehalococcoidia bacterium]MCL0074260.1 DUF58 domain-containing protein [Dehalococcoidia bacterium]MCL0097440.1 DUF58 domain-containing protein [Dehalococcoidia bacterium]